MFHRKKKSSSILAIEDFDEALANKNTHVEGTVESGLQGLAILENQSDDASAAPESESKDDLKYLLQNLHMRTQHLVGKVTPAGMVRLAATNHVATAANRYVLNPTCIT